LEFQQELESKTTHCVGVGAEYIQPKHERNRSQKRIGSGLKAILAGSGLDRTAIFFKIGGSELDRTEKIFVVLMGLFWEYQKFNYDPISQVCWMV